MVCVHFPEEVCKNSLPLCCNMQLFQTHLCNFQFNASDWLDDQEVTAMFKISLSTLVRLRRKRTLPFICLAGKTLYSKYILYQKLFCLMQT